MDRETAKELRKHLNAIERLLRDRKHLIIGTCRSGKAMAEAAGWQFGEYVIAYSCEQLRGIDSRLRELHWCDDWWQLAEAERMLELVKLAYRR